MKKILCVLSLLLLANSCNAKEIDRRIVVDTPVKEVEQVVLDVIKQYDGVVTVKDIDNGFEALYDFAMLGFKIPVKI